MKSATKPLTIAIIMQSPDLGGAETYMLSLIDRFLKRKCKVLVASNRQKFFEEAKKYPVTTYEIPMILDVMGNIRGLIKTVIRMPYALYYYINLLQSFKKAKTDIILMSGFTEKLLVTLLSVYFKIPVFWIEYGRMETIFARNFSLPKLLYTRIHPLSKKVFVPSRNTMESLLTTAGIPKDKIILLPLGIKTSPHKLIKRTIQKQQFKGKFIIGNVSRLTTEKGQDYLIKSIPYVLKSVPNAHLILVGEGPDKKYYQELIKELKVQKHVTITGFVPEVRDYYEIMDLFVFPTVWDLEGFGLVTAEAMLYKLPVIGTTQPPVPEIVDEGITGELVSPKDEKALAEKIINFYKNPKKMKRYGENGYKKVMKDYDITSVVDKTLSVMHSI